MRLKKKTDLSMQIQLHLALIMACRERNEIAVRQLLCMCADELETRTAKAIVRKLERMLHEADRAWFLNRIVMKVGAPA